MLTLKTLNEAESFVNRQKMLGNDVTWENYDIVFYRPDARAMTSRQGAFRNGEWAYKNVSPLGEDGTWNIDYRNVKRAPRNRD